MMVFPTIKGATMRSPNSADGFDQLCKILPTPIGRFGAELNPGAFQLKPLVQKLALLHPGYYLKMMSSR